jgi:hypothetical protein
MGQAVAVNSSCGERASRRPHVPWLLNSVVVTQRCSHVKS